MFDSSPQSVTLRLSARSPVNDFLSGVPGVEGPCQTGRERELARITFYVYILSSGTRHLYIGMTSNLMRRILEHRSSTANSFTARYAMTALVYYEETNDAEAAMFREK